VNWTGPIAQEYGTKRMSDAKPSGKPALREVFLQALEITSPAERQAYLERACPGNAPLQARIQTLLDHHRDDSFLEVPAVQMPASPTQTYDVPAEPALGTIGRYQLLQKIGEGGCGVVYLAQEEEPVRRRVALKVIKLGMDTREVIARFEAERQALAMMEHPNIAKMIEAGKTGAGRPYFAMELVQGIKITAYCDENKLTPRQRLDLFITVCQAIAHAHQKGIIHRDIKPSNVLVTLHDGVPVPKVIDFGIAKATQARLTDKTLFTDFAQFIGTPAYVSPEQAEMSGLDIDTRTDIYSLGVLLYELLTGKPPFDGRELLASGLVAMRRIIREQEPMRPSARLSRLPENERTTTAQRRSSAAAKLVSVIQGDLDWIVMKALEKDRTRRYDSAGGLASDLRRYLGNEPVSARPPSALYRWRKGIQRHKRVSVAVAVVGLALVGGLGLSTVSLMREREARAAQTAADRARAAETVRAEAVVGIVNELFHSLTSKLNLQGHTRALRQLGESAEQLVSVSLSNAPGAQIRVLELVSEMLVDEPPAKRVQRLDRIASILPRVTDEELSAPRYRFALDRLTASMRLGTQEGDAQFVSLRAQTEEARRQLGPDNLKIARLIRTEALCLYIMGRDKLGDGRMAEALALLPIDVEPALAYQTRVEYFHELLKRGKYDEVERLGRQALRDPKTVPPALVELYGQVVHAICSALCYRGRYDEADALAREQADGLREGNHSALAVFDVERCRAEVWARAFQPQRAIPLLVTNALNPNGSIWDWEDAASVALGAEDTEAYELMSGMALARYASGAEADQVAIVAIPLLLHPQDEIVTKVLMELVERAQASQGLVSFYVPHLRAWLAYRRGRFAEAQAALDQAAKAPLETTYSGREFEHACQYFVYADHYLRAILLAQAGQSGEAQASLAQARKLIGPPPSTTHPGDLGDNFQSWYLAAAARREAEQVLREKGISVPPYPDLWR
jgi:serine/threonine protein kinase/tetratricopeptide (TPR) repeat protein